MVFGNKLDINSHVEPNRVEEKLSKQKAKSLFESGDIDKVEVGSFAGLVTIHAYLFDDVYAFAGQVRDVNLAKGSFSFAPVMYWQQSLAHISAMPQQSFEQIIDKYVEMNVALPISRRQGPSRPHLARPDAEKRNPPSH